MSAATIDIAQQLASLLRETGRAHHKASVATNGDDPEWAIWYAEYLHLKLNALMHAHWTKSDIVYLLIHAEKERSAISPGPEWPEFYARRFVEENRQVASG